MELLWEYTFPVIDPGAQVTLQKGSDDLVGVAITDHPDLPPSVRSILIGGRKMRWLPQSIRTIRASFFEVDLSRKQITTSSMIVPTVFIPPLQLFYDQERAIWLGELERPLPLREGLEIYKIHPEEDPQWIQQVVIKGDQVDVGDNRCVAFWKANNELQCLFLVPDVGESDDDQIFWATWSLQTTDVQEKIQQIGYTDAIVAHIMNQGCLLFLYQRLLDGVKTPFSDRTGSGTWQLSCIAYDKMGHLIHREVIPQLTTPIRDLKLPDHDLFESFLLQVAVEQGPLYGPEQQPTCVAVATRREKTSNVSTEEQRNVDAGSKRKEEVEVPTGNVGRLLWMDQQGQTLWAEDGRVGEHVALCCCGETVVGTDLLEGRWRLWHWQPSARTGIQGEIFLPADVIKVTVLAKEPYPGEKETHFWCLEQYDRGLRVVQRENEQENEVMAIWCKDFTLFYDRPGTGFQIERCQGVVLSEGRLVLLGQDQNEKVKLICIQ